MKQVSKAFLKDNLRSLRFWILVSVGAVILAVAAVRLQLYLLSELTDAVASLGLQPDFKGAIWSLMIVYTALHLTIGVFWRCSGFAGMRWITSAKANLIQQLFDYISDHSANYYSSRFAGSLATKINNVQVGVVYLSANFLWAYLPLLIGLFCDVVLLLTAHWLLALILFIWLAFYALINTWAAFWIKKYYYVNAEKWSDLKGKIIDSSANISTVQYAPGIAYERRFVSNYINIARKSELSTWYRSEYIHVTNNIILTAFVVSMLVGSVILFDRGLISIGNVVLVISLIVTLERDLFYLSEILSASVGKYGEIREGLDDLLVPHEISDNDDSRQLVVTESKIEFKAVGFAYGNQEIFKDLNFTIEAGEKIGIVGVSGAGKSTLIALLLRQYEIDSGQIYISGINTAEATLDSLRSAIAFVPQSTDLFHRSILENIRFGNFKATDSEVRGAAKLAYADQFIQAMPEQYQTMVGERGIKLSGGQRQRIAIARAILKNAPILILDEATSALDSESEVLIQEALAGLMQSKTVIAIAHRLSTLKAMDRILVMQGGRFVESGTHHELILKEGHYARLWDTQAADFIKS